MSESKAPMNGNIKELGGSFVVVVDGEEVALRPDRESAEKCLLDIYLFRQGGCHE